MSLFEFTFALSAVILGLALTHVAASIHKLLLAGRRVKWALEPVLLAVIVLLVIVSVWLSAWADREVMTVTIGQMLLQTAKLLTLYVAAASCLPEPVEDGPVDLGEYYNRTRLLSFGALIVSLLLFRCYQVFFGGLQTSVTFSFIWSMLLYPSLYTLLLFVRRRWVNILVLGFITVHYSWLIIGVRLTA